MAIAFVSGVGATDATSGTALTTASYTVSSGSLLVAVWRFLFNNAAGSGGVPPTVTMSDSRGNTWATAVVETSGLSGVQDGWTLGIAYAMNATAGATTFTMTIANSRSDRGLAILEYSGAATSSALLATGNGRGTGSTVSTGTYTASGNSVTVASANTVNGNNLADWTGLAVGGNATTGRSPAAYDSSAYIRDYISSAALTGAISSANSNNSAIYKLIVSASFAESGITYTYARPTSDITTQWSPSTGIDHYALIDETTASDADYIYATAAGQTDEVKLASMSAPQAGTDLKVNYRVQGITDGGNVTVTLVLGGAVVKTDTTRLVDGDYSMDVTPTDYAGVTDWTDVALRFVS
jgi:hypothetical protein